MPLVRSRNPAVHSPLWTACGKVAYPCAQPGDRPVDREMGLSRIPSLTRENVGSMVWRQETLGLVSEGG